MYLTNHFRSVYFENSEVMFVDLTRCDEGHVEVELLHSLRLRGNLVFAVSMKSAVSELTLFTGRMRAPPAWTQQVRYDVPVSVPVENLANFILLLIIIHMNCLTQFRAL